jgi:hypothetical protein
MSIASAIYTRIMTSCYYIGSPTPSIDWGIWFSATWGRMTGEKFEKFINRLAGGISASLANRD